jgi:hypothetical protein
MAKTKVTKTEYEASDGDQVVQYRTTVPKSLVEAMELEGKSLDWKVKSGNSLELRIVDDE